MEKVLRSYICLNSHEAALRSKKDGLNEVSESQFSFFKTVPSDLWNLSVWILEATFLLELLLGKGIQSSFVLLMLLFAAFNGTIQKRRSIRVLWS